MMFTEDAAPEPRTADRAPAVVAWPEANQRYLSAALAVLGEHLEGAAPPADRSEAASRELDEAERALPAPAAIDVLAARFGLSTFERAILLLCAGVELDAALAARCAAAQPDLRRSGPTFSLALSSLPGAHWSALTPAAPLRRHQLVEVGPGDSLTTSPLRIAERVLHYLTGIDQLDERVSALVELLPHAGDLVPSHRALAIRMAAAWSEAPAGALPVLQLSGTDIPGRLGIAAAACAALELTGFILQANALPTEAAELASFARLWERDAILSAGALVVACEGEAPAAVTRLAERVRCPLIVSARDAIRGLSRPSLALDVRRPTAGEQRALWRAALGVNGHAHEADAVAQRITGQFDLGASSIHAACAVAAESAGAPGPDREPSLERAMWTACRTGARARIDDLAKRLERTSLFEDLVLPEAQHRILRSIATHVRHRSTVHETWGFARRSARGLGISALFAGPSGTGKTMAAEALAGDLGLDVYAIDLSQVVSKYIGETEKNLRRLFDAAEEGGAILLFDEADALFGKRSEVKDSHDRYANIEVGYLLQRVESYRGLAILTTNMMSALDPAFLRRLRFVVQFPFPGAPQRADIWRRIYPSDTPTEGLDIDALARLNVSGGNIASIAINAAFLAADAGEPVRMPHVLRAAQAEYHKLGRPLTSAETGGAWPAP